MDSSGIGAALQDVLTRGLDAATAYYTTRLTVNDPTPSITGPNGTRVPVGQSAAFSAAPAGIPLWVWLGGALVLGIGVTALLRR